MQIKSLLSLLLTRSLRYPYFLYAGLFQSRNNYANEIRDLAIIKNFQFGILLFVDPHYNFATLFRDIHPKYS